MTELELLRELGDETPLPDLTELAAARAQLLSALSAADSAGPMPRPRRTPTGRRRLRLLVLAPTLGVAALAAVAFALLSQTDQRSAVMRVAPSTAARHGQPLQSFPVLAHPTAAEVLRRAAFVARQMTATIPEGSQFVYVRNAYPGGHTAQSWLSVDGKRSSRLGEVEYFPKTRRSHLITWSLPGCATGTIAQRTPGQDGKPLSDFIPKRLRDTAITQTQVADQFFHGKLPMDGPIVSSRCTPEPTYFQRMPKQAGQMLSYLEKSQGVYSDANDLNDLAKTVSYLLGSAYLLPAQQAALYTLMAERPGVKVRTDVRDVAGRAGIGLVWSYAGSHGMLIFDARTYAYLGTTTFGPENQIGGTALLAEAIVNSVGQVPRTGKAPKPSDGA